ncbi:MAG: hypothetical protein HY720_13610 [Planctomycetes bacterium]|nr:hypothetical protein [Planctomycetota bacterium]
MRTLSIAIAVIALASSPVVACPASYVHDLGQENMQSDPGGAASQVADGYMLAKGCDPTTPAGQVVKPYVVGTTVHDREYPGAPGQSGSTVDECVQDALQCSHHEQHFEDGCDDAGIDPNGTPSTTLGG